MIPDILRGIARNLEFYATLVVCSFLLILEIFGLVEPQLLSSAILAVLMLLALGGIRDRAAELAVSRSLETLALNSARDGPVRWYMKREDATADMKADMSQHRQLVFFGVSHRQLEEYLRDAMSRGTTLPWESIEVYFAAQPIGEAYEGSRFGQHLRSARHAIASVLTDPTYRDRIPQFRAVRFYQQNGVATHTGCMFGANARAFSVIYAVHSAVRLHGDTHQGLTIRLTAVPGSGTNDHRFDHYADMYKILSQSSTSLGHFGPTVWNSSAREWGNYARQSEILPRSASIVANMISPPEGEIVLDVGSGTGDSACLLLKQHPHITLVVLDGSPQMIRALRSSLGDDDRVRIALCHLPDTDGSGIDIRDIRFATIVIHQSLTDLSASFGSLDELVMWIRNHLKVSGEVVVCEHNTVIETERPAGFESWQDPLRERLGVKLRKVHKPFLRTPSDPKAPRDVVAAFERYGFHLAEHRTEVLDLSYDERRRLWHVPAVMDSVVDVTRVPPDDVRQVVDEAIAELRGQRTMPRTAVIWRFILAP